MRANTITVSDLTYIIKNTPPEQNIMLVGKHGIGKSEILTGIYTKEFGIKVVPLFLGQMSDPGDIIGLPYKNEKTGRTEFLPPYWFPTDDTPIVLFLDELNRARPEILQAVQDLTLNRTIAGRPLPVGSIVISAINAGNEYTLTDIDPALLSRFNVYYFSPSVNEWVRWAANNGVDDRVISFISSHSNLLDCNYTVGTDSTEKTHDRRSWKRVSDFIKICPFAQLKSQRDSDSWLRLICGIVGDVAGAAFVSYIKDSSFLLPQDVLTDFDKSIGILSKMDTLSLMQMTVRICVYINNLDPAHMPISERKALSSGLCRYVNYLYNEAITTTFGTTSRENAQYFVGEIETGLYPKLMAFINMTPELDDIISKIIDESEC